MDTQLAIRLHGISKWVKLQGEVGHDLVKPSGESTRNLTKLTIAPTLALGHDVIPAFFSRPELRLFYSCAFWNGAAAAAADGSTDSAIASISSTGVFSNARYGSTVGLQFEGWWEM